MARKRLKEEGELRYINEFYKIISGLNTEKDVKNFLKDLLSPSERVMISRRIQIAKMLFQGLTYDQIKESLKVGNSTISNVDNWVINGFGGYKEAIKKVEQNKKSSKNTKSINNFSDSFESFRKKRPAQFALLNLLLDGFKK